jgi:hypothetical protein
MMPMKSQAAIENVKKNRSLSSFSDETPTYRRSLPNNSSRLPGNPPSVSANAVAGCRPPPPIPNNRANSDS